MSESLSLLVVAVVGGTAIGWLIRSLVARREAAVQSRGSPLVAEPDYLRREVSRLRNVEQRLARQLFERDALVSTTAAASRSERDDAQVELDRTREALDRLRGQLAAVERSGGEVAAEKEANLRTALATAADLSRRAAVERERDAKVIAEAEMTRSLLATEALDLKRRVSAAAAAAAQMEKERETIRADCRRLEAALAQRDAETRTQMVSHQREMAARDAQIGALEAQVARNEKLQRRVEDREVLLRSVAAERDEAIAANHVGQRDLAATTERLRKETAARLASEAAHQRAAARLATLEAAIARLTKEGEARESVATRSTGTIDTLRAEIRDRDTRFQALLNDRRRVVEAGLMEIARLRDELARDGSPSEAKVGNGKHPDDLKRITGIGPALEKLLHDRGVVSFRQIALWTDTDIERIATELGSFRQRIRRDDWVGQARREHQANYGELV